VHACVSCAGGCKDIFPAVPGASPPVDVPVFFDGGWIGSAWFVMVAEPLVDVTPSRVVLHCSRPGQRHAFCVKVHSIDASPFDVDGVTAQGSFENLSLRRDGEGYRVCGVYRCTQGGGAVGVGPDNFGADRPETSSFPCRTLTGAMRDRRHRRRIHGGRQTAAILMMGRR